LAACSIIALCNFAAVLVVILAKFIKRVYLGDLRPNEVERVNESLRYTIPEVRSWTISGVPPALIDSHPPRQVCIALTVFREELNLRIVALFAALLFSKFFHVLIDERMNHVRRE